jgi:transcriptional regulator with XRE-family HTH domain
MIKIVKHSTGLSQSQISQYIRTTRSAVDHSESGRRQLASKASLKLVNLIQTMQEFEDSGTFTLPVECIEHEQNIMEKQLEDIKKRLAESGLRKILLQHKLNTRKLAYNRVILNLKVEPAVIPTLNDDPENDKPWLKMITNEAIEIFPYNCQSKQSMIQLEIDLLAAEQKVLNTFLKKNEGKKQARKK